MPALQEKIKEFKLVTIKATFNLTLKIKSDKTILKRPDTCAISDNFMAKNDKISRISFPVPLIMNSL